MYKLEHDPIFAKHTNKTRVTIVQESPYRYIEEELQGNWSHQPEEDIIDEVLSRLAKEMNPKGALIELEVKQAELTDLIEKAEKAIERMQEQTRLNEEAMTELAITVAKGVTSEEISMNEISDLEIEEGASLEDEVINTIEDEEGEE